MDAIDRLRRFNRDYPAGMGLLSRNDLNSGLSVAESRVLHELAGRPGVAARRLAEDLTLDEGYLSRIVKRFAARGWIRRVRARDDARQWHLSLTEAGAAACRPLVALSRAAVADRFATTDRADAAADAADLLLNLMDPPTDEVVLRDLQPGDAGWLVEQHARLYFRDEGFDHTFEALVAEILADFLRNRDGAVDRGWIAARGSVRRGSIFCVRQDAETAKLRLFLLLPQARGIGLGRRMLDACMAHARATGHRRMQLWTHESHRAACALYRRSGWQPGASVPRRSFGQDVVEQHWTYTF